PKGGESLHGVHRVSLADEAIRTSGRGQAAQAVGIKQHQRGRRAEQHPVLVSGEDRTDLADHQDAPAGQDALGLGHHAALLNGLTSAQSKLVLPSAYRIPMAQPPSSDSSISMSKRSQASSRLSVS